MATDPDKMPREPSAFRPSLHFPERFHDCYEDDRPPRHLDDEIVRGCIENGEVTDADPDIYWYRETFDGVTYRLVVNDSKREVITGYPISINTEVAESSGRWTPEQIEDVRRFIKTDPRQDSV